MKLQVVVCGNCCPKLHCNLSRYRYGYMIEFNVNFHTIVSVLATLAGEGEELRILKSDWEHSQHALKKKEFTV